MRARVLMRAYFERTCVCIMCAYDERVMERVSLCRIALASIRLCARAAATCVSCAYKILCTCVWQPLDGYLMAGDYRVRKIVISSAVVTTLVGNSEGHADGTGV